MIGVEKYYFLFAVAVVWMIAACVQDIKRREVDNWLTFSLIAFALAYRAFFASYSSDWMFFVYGLLGFGLFFVLANVFYYSRVFAGGDAKLLMGIGAVLPFEKLVDLALVGGGFVFVLFLIGAVYSLGWSIYIAGAHRKLFAEEFVKSYEVRSFRIAFLILFAFFLIMGVTNFISEPLVFISVLAFPVLSYLLFVYLKAVDKCMIKLVLPGKLTEGDWLVDDIRVGRGVIRKTVHGLSLSDIAKLRKAGRKVLIKEGVPFVPAILAAFLIMVFFLAASGFDFSILSSFLP